MSETKHTPGPWFASAEDCEVFSTSTHTSVAMVLMADRWEANARLIAAAPEMLEALLAIADADTSFSRAVKMVDAALSKATA